MEFLIKVSYTDGDSFHTYKDTEILEYGWTDESIVIDNMKAIIEHYEQFYAQHKSWSNDKKFDPACKEKWWYFQSQWDKKISSSLYLKRDNETLFQYTCPWCGYFESLDSVEMVIKTPTFTPKIY